jgi:hypothetical protein
MAAHDDNEKYVVTAPAGTESMQIPSAPAVGTPAASNDIVGSWDDPNGHVVPADTAAAADYYKDTQNDSTPVSTWKWSPISQSWFPIIT